MAKSKPNTGVTKQTSGTDVNLFSAIDPALFDMAKEAAQEQGMDDVAGSGHYHITLEKNGKFKRGNDSKGNPNYIETPFSMVVMDYGSGRRYFPNGFNKDKIETPKCWSTSMLKSPNHPDMTPGASVEEPQADMCKNCPHFEFGGDCDPEYRLAVFPVVIDEDGNRKYMSSEISIARLPPTSLTKWNSYVKTMMKGVAVAPGKKQDLPSYFFIIEVTSEDTGEGYFRWNFEATVPVDMEVQQQLRERITEAEDAITQGYGLRGSKEKEEPSQEENVTEDMKGKV